jgi:hypothetical protein
MGIRTDSRRDRLPLIPLLLAALIVLGGAWLRLHNLAVWPPGLSNDEAINGIDSARLVRAGNIPFYLPDARPEPLFRLFSALIIAAGGTSVFILRYSSALLGILSIAAAYRAGRHLGPAEWSRWTGLLAAGALAGLIGHITLSRAVYRASLLVPALLLEFDALCAFLKWGRRRDALMTGLWLAVIVMSYTSGLAALPAVGGLILLDGIVRLRGGRATSHYGRSLLILCAAFVIAVSPYVWLLIDQPGLLARVASVQASGDLLSRLNAGLTGTLESLTLHGDINPQYNVAAQPLLNTWVLIALMSAGLIACAVRIRRWPHLLAALWLILLALPMALSNEIPHGLRISGEYAAVPLIIAAGVEVWRWLADSLGGWARLAPRLTTPALAGVLAAGVIASGAQNWQTYSTYFQSDIRWQGYSAFGWFFETNRLALAQAIEDTGGVVYFPLGESTHPSMRYFTLTRYPRVTTYATYFGDADPLVLPAGHVIVPWGSPPVTDFAAYMPDGTIVLLPRFDDTTVQEIAARIASSEAEPISAPYNLTTGYRIAFPETGESFSLSRRGEASMYLNYADQIILTGQAGDRSLAQAGKNFGTTLYLRRGSQTLRDPLLFTQLWDQQNQRLASSGEAAVYRWFFPPGEWGPGDIVPYPVGFEIPAGLAPGAYQLALGLKDWRGRYLPVHDSQEGEAGDVGIPAMLKVPYPDPVSTEGMIGISAVLGEDGAAIKLLGYRLTDGNGTPVEAIQPGQTITVTLYWQAIDTPLPDNTLFVHLQDGANNLIAQNDSRPRDGRYPTSVWDAGEIVMSVHPLTIPAGSIGPYSFYAGMYDVLTQLRLPVTQNDQAVPDQRVWITSLP